MMDEQMTTPSSISRSRIESDCIERLIAPVNIWMPEEYLPSLNTRKIRTRRITRTKPRPFDCHQQARSIMRVRARRADGRAGGEGVAPEVAPEGSSTSHGREAAPVTGGMVVVVREAA